MSGPIVRSGASPAFSKNWESIFGGAKSAGKKAGGKKSSAGKAKTAGKSPKKKVAKKKSK